MMIMVVVGLTLGAIVAIGLPSREEPPMLIEGIAALGVLVLGCIASLLHDLTKRCRPAVRPGPHDSN